MTGKRIANVPASIKHRLKSHADTQAEDFNVTLVNYAIERLLARLERSPYADQFVLKGAQIFKLWMDARHRPTRDLDLLRLGLGDQDTLINIFKQICSIKLAENDGIMFQPDTVKCGQNRLDEAYSGFKITVDYILDSARNTVQIDIGIGDATVPRPTPIEIPSLLNFDPIQMLGYSKETAIAEKLDAMIQLGITNSRMKDFYDVVELSRTFSFAGEDICDAVSATLARRRTPIPASPPVALTSDFHKDPRKQQQWNGFLTRNKIDGAKYPFEIVIVEISTFLQPILTALLSGNVVARDWKPRSGWQQRIAA